MKTLVSISFAVVFSLTMFSSCFHGFMPIRGEGEIVSQQYDYTDFDEIELEGCFDVVVNQGDAYVVEVVGHENIIDFMDISKSGDKLKLDLQRGNFQDFDLTVYVTLPNVEKIDLSGAGTITLEGFVADDTIELSVSGSGEIRSTDVVVAEKLTFDISGSGAVDFDADCKRLETEISGSGDVSLRGYADRQDIEISGSGAFDCFDLISLDTDVTISGAGDCSVNVSESLDVTISGLGNVEYIGSPAISTSISGLGRVINRN